MFENERALLVAMALDAGLIGADRKLGLLAFKAAMGVVTIGALHRAFQHSVMEWLLEG